MAKVGLKNLYYAKIVTDDNTGVVYSDPVQIAGVITVDVKTASDTSTLFADDGPYETASSLGEISVDVDVADLGLDAYAQLLGHTVDKGVLECSSSDSAPEIAIGFESLKSNGKKRFVWLYKGSFSEPDDSYKTKEDKIDFQTQKISGKFVIRKYDGKWKKVADEDATGYVATTGTNWYKKETINVTAPVTP